MADLPSSPPHKVAGKGLGKGLSTLKNMPMWAWVIVGGAFLAFLLWRHSKNASNATTAADTPADPNANGYIDPSLYGGLYANGSLPNGTGAATNPTDAGAGTVTGATTTTTTTTTGPVDSHDISTSDSHDVSNSYSVGDTSTSVTLGDINSPLFTGGGAPNRPDNQLPPTVQPAPSPKPPTPPASLKPPKPPKPPVWGNNSNKHKPDKHLKQPVGKK